MEASAAGSKLTGNRLEQRRGALIRQLRLGSGKQKTKIKKIRKKLLTGRFFSTIILKVFWKKKGCFERIIIK